MDTATDDLVRAGEGLHSFGLDLGRYDAAIYIANALTDGLDPKWKGTAFPDGIDACSLTVSDLMSCTNENIERQYDDNPKVSYDLPLLLTAAASIRAAARRAGISEAITAMRELHDSEIAGEDPEDEDYDSDHYAGMVYTIEATVKHFDVDPDPGWEPAAAGE